MKSLERQLRAPGVALDQILVGDVPLRLQEHNCSLCQVFETVHPTLYQFFEKVYQTLCFMPKSEKSVPFFTKIVKIDTVLYGSMMRTDSLSDGTSPYPKHMECTPPPQGNRNKEPCTFSVGGFKVSVTFLYFGLMWDILSL